MALDNIRYSKFSKSCVSGHNLIKYTDKSVDECKELCSGHVNCLAFEYGVAHGGGGVKYNPRDCQLQDATDPDGCDGAHLNLDLYVKGSLHIFGLIIVIRINIHTLFIIFSNAV